MSMTKNERFRLIAANRVQKILDYLDSFKNFTNVKNYYYSQRDIENLIGSIKNELYSTKLRFLKKYRNRNENFYFESETLEYFEYLESDPQENNSITENILSHYRDKNEKFKKTSGRRRDIINKEIRLLGNLSNKNYSYTKEELEKIFRTIDKRLTDLEAYFRFDKDVLFSFNPDRINAQ